MSNAPAEPIVDARPGIPTRDDLAQLLAEPTAFRAWLQALVPTTLIGFCGTPSGCPFFEFISEALGAQNVSVTYCSVQWWDGRTIGGAPSWATYQPVPKWVERTVRAIDRLHPLSMLQHPPVSAGDVLGVLDAVDHEYGLAAA